MRKKITIVSMDLSGNCTNRCYRLAQSLASIYDVEIVGTTFGIGTRWGEGLWPPLESASEGIPIRSVRGDYLPRYLPYAYALLRMMDGDVIIACKPRLPSLGLALIRKLFWRTPVILDIDDDELAQTVAGKHASLIKKLINVSGYFWTRVIHPLHRLVNAKLVVSENFRSWYGGEIVPHPMDAHELDPARYDRAKIRAGLGIHPEHIIIGFVGTPNSQKGTGFLLRALEEIRDPRLRLLIVGVSPEDAAILPVAEDQRHRLILIPMQPLARLPEFLAAADIIALPQLPSAWTWGQMPAKLTDAMSMGKCVIASDTADIPKYLNTGRGVTFPAGDEGAFMDGLRWLLERPAEREIMGKLARAYFLQNLTTDKVGEKLDGIIRAVLEKANDRSNRTAVSGQRKH